MTFLFPLHFFLVSSFLFSLCFQTLSAVRSCSEKSSVVPVPGAGATFPSPIYKEWIFGFTLTSGGEDYEPCYQACGSSCGIKCIMTGTDKTGEECQVSFAGSDSVLTETHYSQVPDLQMYPMVAGAVVPMYNLGVTGPQLVLGRQELADIFSCSITHWRDTQIVKLNSGPDQLCPEGNLTSPNCLLPDAFINVYHRSDGSGTTETFTRALHSFSQEWREHGGEPSSTWPDYFTQKCEQGPGTSDSGSGNYGTFALVLSNEFSITYVSAGILANTEEGEYSKLVNKDGYTVDASAKHIQQAMRSTEWDQQRFTGEMIDAPGESWPISTYTYIVFRKNQTVDSPFWRDCESTRGAIEFFEWSLTDPYPIFRTENLGYVPLESSLATQVIDRMKQEVYCDGRPAIVSFRLPIQVSFSSQKRNEQAVLWSEMFRFSVEEANKFSFSSQGLKGWEMVLQFNQTSIRRQEAHVGVEMKGTDVQIWNDQEDFVQMQVTHDQVSQPVIETISNIGWDQIALIITPESDSLEISSEIRKMGLKKGINSTRFPLSDPTNEEVLKEDLMPLVLSGLRVIVACVSTNETQDLNRILKVSSQLGLLGEGFNWIFTPVDQVPEIERQFRPSLEGAFTFIEPQGRNQQAQQLEQRLRTVNQQEFPSLFEKYVTNGETVDKTSLTIYDSIFTIGWSYDHIISPMNEFEIEEHGFEEMMTVIQEQVFFEGVTGEVSFDSQTHKRLIEWSLDSLVVGQGEGKGEEGEGEWEWIGTFSSEHNELDLDKAFMLSGGDFESPPPDYVPYQKPVVKMEWDSTLTQICLAFTVAGLVMTLYFLAETFHFADRKIIRAASLFFLRLILIGSLIGFVSNFLLIIPPTDYSCRSYLWLSWTAFTILFGGLLTKTYRIWRLFVNIQLKQLQITDLRLIAHTFGLFSIGGVILLLWTLLDPPYVTDTATYYDNDKTAQRCTSQHNEIWSAVYLIPFVFVLIGLSTISFMTRNIKSKFNESRNVGLSIYHFTFCFLVSVLLSIALIEFMELALAIRFFGVYFGQVGVLIILYGHNIYVCYTYPDRSNSLTPEPNIKTTGTQMETTTVKESV